MQGKSEETVKLLTICRKAARNMHIKARAGNMWLFQLRRISFSDGFGATAGTFDGF